LKGTLANGRPGGILELEGHLQQEFRSLAKSQKKLRGCIQQSGLPFYLP
jgi:hypothetical protein